MSKVITAAEAVCKIQNGDTLAWPTAGLIGFAEEIACALEQRFQKTGSPQNLTVAHGSGCGDNKTERGMNHLAYEGLTKRIICGHTGHAPKMADLIRNDKIESYLLPQGVLVQLWRQIAGNRPGAITKIGMGTFVDPRNGGGKSSARTTEDLVKLIEIDGDEWLLYKSFPINVGIIRGTTADENGNLTMDREALILEALPVAQAARNSGGIVIAQVESLAKAGTLDPKMVRVPGILVDYVVVAKPENHMQTAITQYNPALSGELKVPMSGLPVMPLTERKIIARRAAMELKPDTVINLGIGAPDGVASVAAEEGVLDMLTMTTELGTIGGMPAGGFNFGAAYNPDAIIEHQSQFDFYDGGGLDATFLGAAQIDKVGNVNVSKFGARVVGPGGFINISQTAKEVVFCGTMTAGAEIELAEGKVRILKEGHTIKFVDQVDHITFSGAFSQSTGQKVLFVTERAVFTIEEGELTLIEVAPGMDLEKDILAAMAFRPKISDQLKEMPKGIFRETWGELKGLVKPPH